MTEEMNKEAPNVHSIVESDEKRASAMFASSNVMYTYVIRGDGLPSSLYACVKLLHWVPTSNARNNSNQEVGFPFLAYDMEG